MRIIAGRLGGRVLQVPKHAAFRPTTDRVKESVFSMLTHRIDFDGCRVCDLFAGSGSLGLEALSRGAAHVTFVERDRASLDVLRRNLAMVDATAASSVQPVSVESFLRRTVPSEATAFDLVFADPPYAYEAWSELLAAVLVFMRPGGLFLYEHDGRMQPGAIEGMDLLLARTFGTTACTIYQRTEAMQ